MRSEALVALAVAGWLIVLSVRDWRTRDIPEPYTMLPLAAVALYRVALPPEGGFWPGGAALLVAVLMLVVSDYAIPAVLLAGVAGALAGHAGPTTLLLVAGWALTLGAYGIRLWGGADGKVFMTLLALWPTGLLVGLTLGAFVLGNVLALWRRYGGAAPFALFNTARDVLARVPAEQQQLTYLPSLPWLSLGALLYLGARLGGMG